MEKLQNHTYSGAEDRHRRYQKSRHYPALVFIILLNLVVFNALLAQVTTRPLIFFPLDSAGAQRKLSSPLGEISNISAVKDGLSSSESNRLNVPAKAIGLVDNEVNIRLRRLKIANADGTTTPTSFFGIDVNPGKDVSKFTISFWVYVDPSESVKRYLFYGVDASNKLGFGLSLQGQDLYLSKYVNNATAAQGAKITGVTVGNSWETKFLGPATFNAGPGWYQVILVQAPYYTRVFVGMPPGTGTVGAGINGKFGVNFAGSMVMHGKQNLSSFTKWGLGLPEGNTINQPVLKMDDFIVYDYDMTEAQAEALYHCQVANTTETCLGSGQSYDKTFAIIGDYGCDGGAADGITSGLPNVAAMVKSWTPEFILTVGDDSYHDSYATFGCSRSIDNNVGKYYRDYIYPYTTIRTSSNRRGYTRLPSAPSENRFFPALGNHDDNCTDGTSNCLATWTNYFPTAQYAPPGQAGPNKGRYYTFTKGNIQFFAVNSNKEEPDGNTSTSFQAMWLQNALATSTATFKVVYMHHAPYASYNASDESKRGSNQAMLKWPLKEWGADIVISGDDHYYERNDYRNLTYIVNGVGGMPTLARIDSDRIVAGNRVHIEQKFGAFKVQSNANVMHFQFYAINPEDRTTNSVMDEFYLYKRASGATYLVENPVELVRLQAEDKAQLNQAMTVYPNPTSGELTLRLQEQAESNATITLFDFSGKLVYTQQAALNKGTQEISLGNLKAKGVAKGVYFLQVVSPQRNSTVKVVMQ